MMATRKRIGKSIAKFRSVLENIKKQVLGSDVSKETVVLDQTTTDTSVKNYSQPRKDITNDISRFQLPEVDTQRYKEQMKVLSKVTLPTLSASSSVKKYETYWSAKQLRKATSRNGVHIGSLVLMVSNLGMIQLKNYDCLIIGNDLNRAMHGDIVAVSLLPLKDWRFTKNRMSYDDMVNSRMDSKRVSSLVTSVFGGCTIDWSSTSLPDDIDSTQLQPRGRVVQIVASYGNRCYLGTLSHPDSRFPQVAVFQPLTSRFPSMYIPLVDEFCPPEHLKNFKKLVEENLTVVGQHVSWPQQSSYPIGELLPLTIDRSDIESSTRAILVEHGLQELPFSQTVHKEADSMTITKSDFKGRLDLTKECIFTIDPSTARDLDDALHAKRLPDGNVEVGVHIADVGHFIRPGSALDREAAKRATSIYLVQRCIPMLPEKLSADLCSLHPGERKLAFSVIFIMDPKTGNVVSSKFTKSVIQSCAKLSYQEAQLIADMGKKIKDEDKPAIKSPFTLKQVLRSLRLLMDIAKIRREQRSSSGAFVQKSSRELTFEVDEVDGFPLSMGHKELYATNATIEEWMLLANMTAAQFVVDKCPEIALLRCHPPPMSDKKDKLLQLYRWVKKQPNAKVYDPIEMMQCLSKMNHSNLGYVNSVFFLQYTNFSLASYICASFHSTPMERHHYGLNVPLYSHFTSPIRRYPDILLHRQIASILGHSPHQQNPQMVEASCTLANTKYHSSKRASDSSKILFYTAFLRSTGQVNETAFLIGTKNSNIFVFFPNLKHKMVLASSDLSYDQTFKISCSVKGESVTITWYPTSHCPHVISVVYEFMSSMDFVLFCNSDMLQLEAKLQRPACSQCNNQPVNNTTVVNELDTTNKSGDMHVYWDYTPTAVSPDVVEYKVPISNNQRKRNTSSR